MPHIFHFVCVLSHFAFSPLDPPLSPSSSSPLRPFNRSLIPFGRQLLNPMLSWRWDVCPSVCVYFVYIKRRRCACACACARAYMCEMCVTTYILVSVSQMKVKLLRAKRRREQPHRDARSKPSNKRRRRVHKHDRRFLGNWIWTLCDTCSCSCFVLWKGCA